MKDLGKWQMISFLSRGTAMIVGLVQSFVIIRILSVAEWGIVQLAVSIGSALGIYQHLGLASASTREIAAAKNDTDIFKIFLTSVAIRYLVTIPLAAALYLYSGNIAVGLYKSEALILPLKIYAVSLLFVGVQSILNSVISGSKRFKRLFIYQICVSIISLVLFVPFVYYRRIDGYFFAYFFFNVINAILLAFLAFAPLKGKLQFPTRKDFAKLFREIFSISLAIYFVKILSTNWEKLGPNILGVFSSPEIVATFAFAMLYARKILSISDSVTDVSLPVLSEKYTEDISEFKRAFKVNFDKVFMFMILAASIACFWAPQIISVLVGGDKYAQSYRYIPLMLLAFIIYGIGDVIKSSVFVPAKLVAQMVTSYLVLLIGTAVFFYASKGFLGNLDSMTVGLAAGSVFSLFFMSWSIKKSLNFSFFSHNHWLLLVQFLLIGLFGVSAALQTKLLIFPPILLLLVWGLMAGGVLTKADFAKIPFIGERKKTLQ